MTNTNNGVRFLGTTDERAECDCCGRANLKVTVALMFEGAADVVFYGTTCAAKALRMPAKEVKAAAKAADDAKAAAERAVREAAWKAESDRWSAWLNSKVPSKRGEIFLQIEALGGYAAARAAYMEAA